jgi:mono/diheme cytochrome c family protein
MKIAFLLFLVPALAFAQNPDVVKQGEDVFNKTCASGYCHGAGGAGGGAPRIAARGFDQTFISNTVTRGIPNTGMQAFANTLSRAELNAVVAYVAKLNGIANPAIGPAGLPTATPNTPALSADAARGRDLFSDSVRSFGRCSTCHEVNGIGIPVAAPITTIPPTAAALKALATARVSTATISSESMPILMLSNRSQGVLFYDLTTAPPVQRNETPAAVRVREGSDWRHSSVIGAYNEQELSSILEYLRVVNR